MKLSGAIMLVGALLLSSPVLAAGEGWDLSTGHGSHGGNHNGSGHDNDYGNGNGNTSGSNTDVVVDLPPEVWTQGQNRQAPCQTCCTYQNRSYTEGSVVRMEGVLLQCARDEKSWGTNTLIWKTVK
ncbi:DUF1496 domain-containing protein [Erwinia sp. E_sp_B04_7]|uniref:DUF1496 domain-containing protein n=2 Tax=Erwinia TaxID=551 RepID=UPI0030CD93AE